MKNFAAFAVSFFTVFALAVFTSGCGAGSAQPSIAATHFSVSGPSSANAGAAISLTVTALDAANNTATSYAGTVHFASTDNQATLPGDSSLTNGTKTFSVKFGTGGSQMVTVTDTALASIAGSSLIIVSVPPATHFSIAAPNAATAGTAFNFTVTALDAFNNTVTTYPGTVGFTSSDGSVVFSPPSSALTNGARTFSATLNTTGNQTVTATDTVAASIAGTSNPINVSIGVLSITSGSPPSGTVGTRYDSRCTQIPLCNVFADGFSLVAAGGVQPYSWSWAGAQGSSVPPGMNILGFQCLNVTLPAICGTPTLAGSFNVVVAVTDSASPPAQVSADYTIQISAGFSPTGSMGTARQGQTATLLNDGRVLITGGTDANGKSLATAEISDLSGSNFTPTAGSMETARIGHTATLLADGRVLVAGGADGNGTILATAEVFDPVTNTFTPTGSMRASRYNHTATLLSVNNKVLIAGGKGATGLLASAELYDPASGTFAPTTGSMTTARDLHTATLLQNGSQVLVAGGEEGRIYATAEIFDANNGAFTPTGSMGLRRVGHTATLLGDGTVLISGGSLLKIPGGCSLATSTAEIYDPSSGTFAPVAGNMEIGRYGHTATLLLDGTVLVTGGENWTSALQVFPPGCVTVDFLSTTKAEIFDPATRSFAPTGSMGNARYGHTATRLLSGAVLVTGGFGGINVTIQSPGTVLATAEIYK